ncbi:hypothetical protein [Paraburkholderia panacisoli]|nr:hypothetical protein [Paraburkholderia panacisoli]
MLSERWTTPDRTICQSIIEAHGGSIWVVRNEAQGVTFSFSLPIDMSDVT